MEENVILSAIKGDEKLLWSGKAGKFETLDAVYKPKLIKDAIISLASMLVLVVGYILLTRKNGAGVMPLMIILIVVCVGIIPASVFINANKLRKSISYAVTDKRLIVANDHAKSAGFETVKEAKFYTDEAGVTSLLCGNRAVRATGGKIRGLAVGGCHIDEQKNICDSLVFYGIEDAEKLRSILKPYISIE